FHVALTASAATATFAVCYSSSDYILSAADRPPISTLFPTRRSSDLNAQTFTVTINGDTKVEPNEAFFDSLSGATNGAVISKSQGTGTIINDDVPPPPAGTVAINDVTITEGNSGTQLATFTVTRTGTNATAP